jgi:hypothetical protein
MDANVTGDLDALELVVAVARPAIVVLLLLGLWRALGRAGVQRRPAIAVWLAVAVPLTLWLGGIWAAALSGVFQVRPGLVPRIPIAVVVPVVIGLIAVTRSRRIAAAVDAAPSSWLVGVQVYRVIGGIFLLQWLHGALPGAFAVPAGAGDMLVGLLALPVAAYAASGRRGSTAVAVAWNVLGIADLVNALTLGFLSAPGPLQLLAHDHPNLLVGVYPTAMIPAFAVPLSLILHGVSLWQLRRRSRSRALAGGTRPRLGPAVHASASASA